MNTDFQIGDIVEWYDPGEQRIISGTIVSFSVNTNYVKIKKTNSFYHRQIFYKNLVLVKAAPKELPDKVFDKYAHKRR